MANYTKLTNFAAKDALPSGNAAKIVRGTEINTEFDNIAVAVATKQDFLNPTAGVATFLGTPSSANLAAALTDETGSGAAVFATSPTLSGPTFNDGYTEEVFAVTGTTPALSPTDGSIQTWTLSGNSTPTAGTWAAGQSITLMIDDGTASTVTWSSLAVTWKTDSGNAPTLNTTGFTVIQLWKVGTVIYGARVGNA